MFRLLSLAPPGARGFLAGQHGGFAILGYAIAGWVGVGTYYSANPSFQWRFPIAMACVFPVALLACSPLVPESPRWREYCPQTRDWSCSDCIVLSRGDRETAWQIVLRLHDDGTDDARHFARESFFQMEKQAESDAIAWADGGNRQLFTRPSYRKRMFMGFFIQYAAQSTGAQVIYGQSVAVAGSIHARVDISLYYLPLSKFGTLRGHPPCAWRRICHSGNAR